MYKYSDNILVWADGSWEWEADGADAINDRGPYAARYMAGSLEHADTINNSDLPF